MQRTALVMFMALAVHLPLMAQDGFLARWQQRATQTQLKQPAWAPPLVTPYVGLIQVYRTDFARQTASNHVQTWSLGGSKGLNLIPAANTELDVNLPPYLEHSAATVANGAGDMSFLLKYRFLARAERHGNYEASAFMAASIPTGSYKNGGTDAMVSPNLGLGKGFGPFDVQTTIGAVLPVHDTATLGRAIAWNIAGQAHLVRYFWPQVEFNSTYFRGGPNDGKVQTFATPGMLVARKFGGVEQPSRLALCVGAGEQIATSTFHTYNHQIIVTTRLLF